MFAQNNLFLFCFKKGLKGREREKDGLFIPKCLPQVSVRVKVEPGPQDPRTPISFSTWVAGTQAPGPSFAAFSGLAWSWIRSTTSLTVTGALTWNTRPRLSISMSFLSAIFTSNSFFKSPINYIWVNFIFVLYSEIPHQLALFLLMYFFPCISDFYHIFTSLLLSLIIHKQIQFFRIYRYYFT